MQRSRNIRKKVELVDDESTVTPDATEIKLRQPRKTNLVPVVQQESSRQLLEQVQDRVYTEPIEEVDLDEDLVLKKRAEIARAKRDAARQGGQDEYMALDDDETPLGPLEMIADTGVDEEVFEDNRGKTIKFGLSPTTLEVLDEDMMLEDDESRQWEMDQIQKGMASAGIKADREQRQVVKELGKEAKPVEKTELIDFGSLDFILTELIQQADQLESVIANHQIELKSLQSEADKLTQTSNETLLSGTTEKVAFHAEISEFISTFSQFSLEATKLMDSSEIDLPQLDAFFDDALTEYSSAGSLLSKVSQWRQLYPVEYADSFVEHQLPFLLEIFVQRQLFSLDLLKNQVLLADMIDQLLGDVDVSAQLKISLIEEVYIPRMFTKIAANFDPGDPVQTMILKNMLTDISGHVNGKSKSLDLFKFVLSDIFSEAKSSCEPGSDKLQQILLNQSILGIST